VRDRLPSELSRATRRHVLQGISRLLTLAVYPAKLLPANPLQRGFLPKVDTNKAKAYLYPAEDRALLACGDVPLLHRMFYGLLVREGLRVSELLGLTWDGVDLVNNVLTLDKNKTNDPRSWALDPGVQKVSVDGVIGFARSACRLARSWWPPTTRRSTNSPPPVC
jgi:integrase